MFNAILEKMGLKSESRTAIQVNRQYNGTIYEPEYVINPASKTKLIIAHVKAYTKSYQAQEVQRHKLPDLPTTDIKEGLFGLVPNKDIEIVGVVNYEYQKQTVNFLKPSKKLNIGTVLFFMFITFCIVTGIIFGILMQNTHEQIKIDNTCYVFTKNDVAYKVKIREHIYELDENGHIKPGAKPFINPWHRGRVENPFQYCKIVKIGEVQ